MLYRHGTLLCLVHNRRYYTDHDVFYISVILDTIK